jgi:hypothetical protein
LHQVNDVTVDKTPNILVRDPTENTHALAVKAPHNPAQMVILPLALQGVILLINVRVRTLDEWNSDAFTRLSLTSESLTWDQTTTQYEKQEAAMTNYSGSVVNCTVMRKHDGILAINSHSSLTTDFADVTDDENFYQVLTLRVQILSLKSSHNGHIRSRQINPIDPQTLAACWMISPDRAKRTVVMTTQHRVRTCLTA